ncbi:ABC transporter ATP-binding protein [Desulfovibrio oxamicus]|uniref:ABC transporter ATP-binding protein n=1 Tax=Nitratidesulfovibrio oxamicus TaxID=32016 RepID=A0ABS0IZ69_9BACT|nr:ABC transporter ATP-binding protein [Nitratidesulfovibrio oxamicus]MBG3875482.1 ABC transporter ATP-binding protein [Nitratidesulfovibrio oxamicus]
MPTDISPVASSVAFPNASPVASPRASADLSVTRLVKRFEKFTAVNDVSFEVEQGRFFSILGPSGCGKTTLLRMIAGFESPDSGVIAIRGRDMAGIAPNRRPVNLIFQHLALFPMMSVAENVAFGLKRRGMGGREIGRRVQDVLERVGLPGYGSKMPAQLSGGQKQRVAIARCLVLEPAVLLLDEPLGALDLKLREQMKVELKTLQAEVGTTFVYITHDQSEALVMSDHVAVMNAGRFEQVDTPRNLYRRPASAFVAGFVGETNVWTGTLEEATDGAGLVRTDEGAVFRARVAAGLAKGARVDMFIRPEAVLIDPDGASCAIDGATGGATGGATSGAVDGAADGGDAPLPVRGPCANRVQVQVQAILFDGAASRLLTHPEESRREVMVALPQNRLYDHIKPGDRITVGWDDRAGICFAAGSGR